MEVGSLLPAASVPPMHVTTPVVEAPLVIQYVAPAPGVTYRAPTPVDEVAFTTSASAVEYVAPAPAVHVAPAPVDASCSYSISRCCRGVRGILALPGSRDTCKALWPSGLPQSSSEKRPHRSRRKPKKAKRQRRGGRTEAEGSPKRQTLIVWTVCEMAIRRELRYTNTGHMSEPRALEVPFVLGRLQKGRDLSPASAGTDSRLRAYRHGGARRACGHLRLILRFHAVPSVDAQLSCILGCGSGVVESTSPCRICASCSSRHP